MRLLHSLPPDTAKLIRNVGWLGLAFFVIKTLYGFFHARLKFRRLKAQGVPMVPHSFLFGHLAIIAKLTKHLPRDFSPQYIPHVIVKNWQSLFPEETACPELLYLDMWPMGPPMIWILDSNLTTEAIYDMRRIVRHPNSSKYVTPFTHNLDLFSLEGPEWRAWRSRLNPGFSTKNIAFMLPQIVEEVAVFRDVLRSKAGPNGTWGRLFQLEPITTNLTFDVIARASLDMRLNEQIRGPENPSPFKRAVIEQISLLMFERNILNLHRHLNPIRWWKLRRNNRIVRNFLMPSILTRLDPSKSASGKTIVDLATEAFRSESRDPSPTKLLTPSPFFIETVLSHLKIFIFAGHDTTAAVLCWALHSLSTHPTHASLVRSEISSVLGPDPASKLATSPNLLNSIPYTSAFIKEAFRLNPAAPLIRLSTSDFVFQKDGKQFPTKGCMLFDAAIAGMRWEGSFFRGDEFLPERWLAKEREELFPRGRNAWRGFGMGPRACIGQELAWVELKLAMVMVVAGGVEIRCDWEGWDERERVKGRAGKKMAQEEIDGHRCFQVGNAIPKCSGGMPVRVRIREERE